MPTIVFKIKGEPDVSMPMPSNKDIATWQAEVALQRSTWFPNRLNENRQLNDDDTFTVSGSEAVYFYNLVQNGTITFLEVQTYSN